MDKSDIKKLIEIEQRCKSNTKRLDEHDKTLKELSNVYIALTKVDDKVTNVESDVCEMKRDIKDIKDKPNKKMDLLWGYMVSAIVGALVTFLAVKLGIK